MPLAAAAGAPYLSFDALSPWILVYAIGLFTALLAVPFALHRRLGGLLEADARWERALLWWGPTAIAALAVGLLLGLPSGFASDFRRPGHLRRDGARARNARDLAAIGLILRATR